MKIKFLVLVLAFCGSGIVHAQETNAPAFGKGLFRLMGQDSTWSMKIAARMQFLTVASWDEGADGGLIDPEQSFSIRRARFKCNGFAYSPKLKYQIELGLSNRDLSGASQFTGNAPRYILDAVVMWNFIGSFEFWMGQTKLPGNIERVISSGNLQQVDRSLLNRRFTIDRDQGIQLRHHFKLSDSFLVREKFAVSQGEGRNIISGNLGGYQYTARLEVYPFGDFSAYIASDLKKVQTPKLMLAATFDHNQDAVKTRSNQGTYMMNDMGFYETDINTIFLDAMFKYKGFSFMGEYANRTAKDPIAKNSDGTETGDTVQIGDGLNLQTGYLFSGDWEVSGRYTSIHLDENSTARNLERQYTLGLSKFIVGHKLKVQSDVSYLSVDGAANELMCRLQVEVHF
ncbi:porin [Aggregatimonas sangjinii]|uniref:Porin n=1 Tax=Aggregatimonas sangjinii TaxID=2583587 RepID=A0A5B7SX68_9FLAO|nr:porin [Aggregatimonas sangjinii]QCX01628.1 porin [Aggregatimonas sangjinii]